MTEPRTRLKIAPRKFWACKVRIDTAPGWRDIFLDVASIGEAVELLADRYSIIMISETTITIGEAVPITE